MAKNKDEEAILVEEVGNDPRVYELGFHLDPELPIEEVKKAFGAVKSLIEEKGTIVVEGEPENIPLAYTISRQEVSGRRDFNSAYFAWIAYEALPEAHAEVIAFANGEKRIIRFIDLLTTKEAARHSAEMHELSLKTLERAEETEPAAAELDAALESVTI
jgi:ribosomal protein S6